MPSSDARRLPHMRLYRHQKVFSGSSSRPRNALRSSKDFGLRGPTNWGRSDSRSLKCYWLPYSWGLSSYSRGLSLPHASRGQEAKSGSGLGGKICLEEIFKLTRNPKRDFA